MNKERTNKLEEEERLGMVNEKRTKWRQQTKSRQDCWPNKTVEFAFFTPAKLRIKKRATKSRTQILVTGLQQTTIICVDNGITGKELFAKVSLVTGLNRDDLRITTQSKELYPYAS